MQSAQIENLLDLTAEAAHTWSSTAIRTFEIPRVLMELQKLASSLHKRYAAECSYQWADTDEYRKRTKNLEKRVMKLAEEHKLDVKFQKDPRGWPLIIMINGNERRIG